MQKQNLLLIPGMCSDQRVWQYQIEHLQDVATCYVAELSNYDNFEAMVNAILQMAPAKFALAGHSMGGGIAQEIAYRAKDRVTKLCLLQTGCRDKAENIKSREVIMAKIKQGQFKETLQRIAEKFTYQPASVEKTFNMFYEAGEQTFIKHQHALTYRQDTLAYLALIKCPTLIVHARHDNAFSYEENKELADNIPNANFTILEDCGHMSTFEMPQAVTALMRLWLTM